MTDSHPSRSKRGKSRRHVHNSVYDAEASRPQGPHQGQGSPHERGTEGGTGATTTFTEQDYSNTRITDLPDDIPSRASSVPSSANIMNHAQPNKLESGHGGDRTQHEGTFDMQGTTTDQRRIEQPHSGVISTPSMLTTLTPKQEETCQKLQDGDHGFEVDSSIQKSTIMIKRLRSKSESKISEGEYRAGHDPGQEQHGNGHKRHLQDHWAGQEPNQVRTTSQQMIFTLPPPREDHGCVLCFGSYEAAGNNIVMCDKCNRGFHQLCYSPTINNRFIEIRELEWHCFACLPLDTTIQQQGLASVTEDMSLTGEQVPRSVKESFLWAMPKADLVQFITRIESSSPALKLYPSRLSSPTDLTDMPRFVQVNGQGQVFTVAQQGLSQLPTPASRMAPDYFTSEFQPTTTTPTPSSMGNATPFSFSPNANTPQSAPLQRTSIVPTGTTEQHKKSASTVKESTESTPVMTGSNYNSVKALDLPPYEEMIFMAIADLREEAGSAPKAILDWVHDHYPVPDTFRASCGQAISKAAKKGRLAKDGALYKLKPGYNYPPKRLPRHTGGPRARSLSYNSGLPLNLQTLGRSMANKSSISSPGFERMGTIMDTNVYDMLPNTQFQVQPGMVAPFNTDGIVVSSGQGQIAHPFKIGKPLVGDTDMVEALAVQPALIGGNMSDPHLVGLGVTPMNSLKQDSHPNFVLGQEMGVNPMMGSSMAASLQAFPNGLQGFRPPHLVQSIHGAQPVQLMQQQPLQHQSQRLHLSTQPQSPLGTVPWNLSGSTPLSLESLAAISPISTPNNNQNPRFFQSFTRQNRAMSITTPIQYPPSMFGDLGSSTPISLTPSSSTSQLASDTQFRQPPRPLPLHMTPGLTNNFDMGPQIPGTPGQGQGQGQGQPSRPQFIPFQQHLPLYNSISAPSSPLEAHMNRANTPSRLVFAGSVGGQQHAMDVMVSQPQQQHDASSSPSLSTASSSSHTSLPLSLMIKDGRVLSRDQP